MKYFKPFLLLFLSLLLFASLVACGTSEPGTTAATSPGVTTTAKPATTSPSPTVNKSGGTLTISFPAMVSSMYSIVLTGNAQYLAYPAVEKLGKQQLDGTFKPFLCESWERDDKALTFTLHLRKGIQFSDGSEFNAEVVKWNLQMMLDHGMAKSLCNPSNLEVVDANTLRIHFDKFSLQWEDSYGACFIYSKLCYDTNGENYAKIHPVGTGPFVLKEYIPDISLHYLRNSNYWQKGLPYLDGYNIELMPDATTRQSAFINGEVSYVMTGEADMIKFLESRGFKNKAVKTASSWSYFTVYLASGVQDDPFYKVNVRKAVLLYGVDWKAIANACSGGYGQAQLQEANEGCYGYNPDIEKESYYDLAKAKSMLQEAGYGDGFKTQIIFANPVYNTLGAALQDQLKNLGITASVSLNTAATTLRNEGKTPGIHLVSNPGSVDPTNLILTRLNRNGQYGKLLNFSDNYEAAVARANSATTLEEKKSALRDVNRYFYAVDCNARCAYATASWVCIADKVHDTGLESNLYSPEIAYLTK